MLMMRRREGESILIGEEIEIHIAHIGRSRVKIAIHAPREVKVVAKEIEMTSRQNRAAAASAPAPDLAGRIARALGKKLSQAARPGADKASEG